MSCASASLDQSAQTSPGTCKELVLTVEVSVVVPTSLQPSAARMNVAVTMLSKPAEHNTVTSSLPCAGVQSYGKSFQRRHDAVQRHLYSMSAEYSLPLQCKSAKVSPENPVICVSCLRHLWTGHCPSASKPQASNPTKCFSPSIDDCLRRATLVMCRRTCSCMGSSWALSRRAMPYPLRCPGHVLISLGLCAL